MTRIPIVDENDKIIGYKKRGTLDSDDIYRVSALWLTNSKGEILIAQRADNKSHNPGQWGVSVAGTVDEGETYYENIIKETEEEIGLKGIKPKKGPYGRHKGEHNYFYQWYLQEIDMDIEDFVIDKEEVKAKFYQHGAESDLHKEKYQTASDDEKTEFGKKLDEYLANQESTN